MTNSSSVISYALAAIAGVCFVQGLAILSNKGGMVDHGESKKMGYNA